MSELSIGSRLTPMLQEKVLGDRAGVGSATSVERGERGVGATPGSSADFLSALESAVMETNTALQTADKASVDFATGKAENLHDVMIAMEKADVSLRTLTAVRGKVLEAYQEIMRMPV